MTLLTREQRAFIDRRIRSYRQMAADIADWREEAINGRRRGRAARRSHDRAAPDPTCEAAVRLSRPPKRIRSYMLWIESIDSAHRKVSGTYTEDVVAEWYKDGTRGNAVSSAAMLNIDIRTLYRHLGTFRDFVAAAAIKRGIFDIEKSEAATVEAAACTGQDDSPR